MNAHARFRRLLLMVGLRGFHRSGAAVKVSYDAIEADGRPIGTCRHKALSLHGEFGEDDVQNILALEISLVITNEQMPSIGAQENSPPRIPTAAYQILHKGDARALPFPLVTKPATQGSVWCQSGGRIRLGRCNRQLQLDRM
jgi:hypothetical protein